MGCELGDQGHTVPLRTGSCWDTESNGLSKNNAGVRCNPHRAGSPTGRESSQATADRREGWSLSLTSAKGKVGGKKKQNMSLSLTHLLPKNSDWFTNKTTPWDIKTKALERVQAKGPLVSPPTGKEASAGRQNGGNPPG